MIVFLLCSMALAYVAGLYRMHTSNRRFPRIAVAAFFASLAVTAAVLLGPMDARADASLSWHMVQHLVLIGVVAPLFIAGAPIRLVLGSLPSTYALRTAQLCRSAAFRVVTHPAIAWLQFTAVLYLIHFSPLYEASLENETVHAYEHLIFLTSALLYWIPILAISPAPHAPGHAVRIFSLFLALPMSAFLGFAFYVSRHVLYVHYAAHPDALLDQMNAGAVMWIAGGGPLFIALLYTVADWGKTERRYGKVADEAGR